MAKRIAFFIFCLIPPLFAATDPSEVDVKVHAVYMSKDAYCSSPIEVFNAAEAGFVDFLGGPTVGQLDNSKFQYDGNYKCVIIKMSETIKFVPILGSGICVAGNRFESNICAAGVVTSGIDGSTSTCTGTNTDDVYLYLTTVSTATTLGTSTNPFLPPTPTTPTNGLLLSSTIQINGSINLRFSVNAYGKIEALNGACEINSPTFGFGL